jgi:hypothetical protein
MLNDNFAGKPEGIHLEIGARPVIAFGNSTGDREMLEYTVPIRLPQTPTTYRRSPAHHRRRMIGRS